MVPFSIRQPVKSVIEMLAAIPSVAYGFFAIVVMAPLFQEYGGRAPAWGLVVLGVPFIFLVAVILADRMA